MMHGPLNVKLVSVFYFKVLRCRRGGSYDTGLEYRQVCYFPFSWHFQVHLVLYFEMSQYALFLILSTSTYFFYDPAKVILPFVLQTLFQRL